MAPSAQRAMDFPTLCVSVNSVDSVRAFLPPDSCVPTFHGGFITGVCKCLASAHLSPEGAMKGAEAKRFDRMDSLGAVGRSSAA
jgi:hypothetical protein